MKIVEPKPFELLNEDWPEVLYGESDWPDEILVNTARERTEITDDVLQIAAFLLSEGKEIGW
jgi:hypothetical protein